MAYGIEVVILMKINIPSRQTEAPMDEEEKKELLIEELDLIEEVRLGESL